MPYFGILFMAMGPNAVIGKRLAITGLITCIYIVFELRRPNANPKELNPAIQFFNDNLQNPSVLWFLRKWRWGPKVMKLKHWTIHQVCTYMGSHLWGTYF